MNDSNDFDKQKLQSKFPAAFELFSDQKQQEAETLDIKQEDLIISDKELIKEKQEKMLAILTNNEEENNTDTAEISQEKKEDFTFTPSAEAPKPQEIRYAKAAPAHYKVAGFFKRTFFMFLDQSVVGGITVLFYLSMIAPNVDLKFKLFERVAYFILNYPGELTQLILFYLASYFIYYTVTTMILGATPFARLFGYKLYHYQGTSPAFYTIMIRHAFQIIFNIPLLFGYLLCFISDFKQPLYDKLFQLYLLKRTD